MQCARTVAQFWKTASLSLKFSLKRMHMGVAQLLDSLFHLILKEAQEALVVVSDETNSVNEFLDSLQYAKKIQTLELVTY